MLTKSKIKYIQSLGQKKFRDEHGVFVAEGPKVVKELLESKDIIVQELFALKDWMEKNEQALSDYTVNEIGSDELDKISHLHTSNQVLAIVKKKMYQEYIETRNNIILALDTIQDPGNFGTIVRIADWFGVDQIVCSINCADIYNPKVVQATMGSIARIKVFYTELISWLENQKESRIYAAALDGKNVSEMTPIRSGVIVIGNESKGIRSEILNTANVKITIPKIGRAESLNAAVATGIILSHLRTKN